MCLVIGEVMSSLVACLVRPQLDPLGLGAKPQQGSPEALGLKESVISLLDKQVSRFDGVLRGLSFVEGTCLRHRGLVGMRR